MTPPSMKQQLKESLHKLDILRKVDVIIAGVQKGATTSVHHALSRHSQVRIGPFKEIGFWNFSDSTLAKELDYHTHKYSALFPTTLNPRARLLDSTPHYLLDPELPTRILEYNPDCKFIINLRHPVSRLFSAYRMCSENWSRSPQHISNNKVESRSLEEILSYEYNILFEDGSFDDHLPPIYQSPYYLNQSLYHSNVKRFIQTVPRNQLMINILEEDIVLNPQLFLNKLMTFLDLRQEDLDMPTLNTTNQKHSQNDMPNFIRKVLEEDSNRLKTVLNREIPSWKL